MIPTQFKFVVVFNVCILRGEHGMLPQSIQGQVPKNPSDPRFNRNSSAHLDELTLKGLLSISIKSQTRPTRANSAT